jgi:hypothetical protein
MFATLLNIFYSADRGAVTPKSGTTHQYWHRVTHYEN